MPKFIAVHTLAVPRTLEEVTQVAREAVAESKQGIYCVRS